MLHLLWKNIKCKCHNKSLGGKFKTVHYFGFQGLMQGYQPSNFSDNHPF